MGFPELEKISLRSRVYLALRLQTLKRFFDGDVWKKTYAQILGTLYLLSTASAILPGILHLLPRMLHPKKKSYSIMLQGFSISFHLKGGCLQLRIEKPVLFDKYVGAKPRIFNKSFGLLCTTKVSVHQGSDSLCTNVSLPTCSNTATLSEVLTPNYFPATTSRRRLLGDDFPVTR